MKQAACCVSLLPPVVGLNAKQPVTERNQFESGGASDFGVAELNSSMNSIITGVFRLGEY
jgi:hypothetical protein